MKKTLLIIIYVLICSGSECFGREEALANAGKSGLYARSIRQVLRLDDEDVDLATAVLIISEQWNDNVRGRRYQTKLNDMAYEIQRRLRAKRLGADHRAVKVINDYLFGELGFRSVEEASNPDDLFLHTVMDRKKGYCLSLSVLYLSIGERLGMPLFGVVVPGHFFVRYDDGQVRFNIETTSKGGYADDEHYINKFNVPERNRNGIYMTNLTSMQTLGCFFNNLGNSYLDIGDIEQALVALETAVDINPSLSESRGNLGNIYLKKGRFDEAVDEYQTALKINPNDSKTHNNLGNAYVQRGWVDDAVFEYRQSIRLDPNFVEAYKNLATAYSKQKRFELALLELRKAIRLEPLKGDLHGHVADVLREMGNCQEAVYQYKKALRYDPDLAEAYLGLGICYKKSGEVDDEIAAYKMAISIKPDMTAAIANLGNAYFSKEEYEAAIKQYKKALAIEPEDGSLYYNLGAAYLNMGDYEKAMGGYEEALEIDPKMGDAHKGLAYAFYHMEDYKLAWKHLERAKRLGVEVPEDLRKAVESRSR